jgi:hypothetical protein
MSLVFDATMMLLLNQLVSDLLSEKSSCVQHHLERLRGFVLIYDGVSELIHKQPH